jgi:hypothetical protein
MKVGKSLVALGVMILVLCLPLPTEAGSLGKAAARGAARSAGKALGFISVERAAVARTEAQALSRVLTDLDRGTLRQIERRFGQHIPTERLSAARQAPTQFLSHEQYQERLTRVYPRLSAAERQQVVGDFTRRPHVDRNQVLLPRTVAHERLHQLRDPRFRAQVGRGLDEGTTELLASRVSGDLGIRDLPRGYPAERRLVEMLEARVGEKPIAQAYFRGEVEPLRGLVDADLGRGAFDRVAQLMAERRFAEAEEILKHGLGSPLWRSP